MDTQGNSDDMSRTKCIDLIESHSTFSSEDTCVISLSSNIVLPRPVLIPYHLPDNLPTTGPRRADREPYRKPYIGAGSSFATSFMA
jgi:hypothetical protein